MKYCVVNSLYLSLYLASYLSSTIYLYYSSIFPGEFSLQKSHIYEAYHMSHLSMLSVISLEQQGTPGFSHN